MQPLESISSDDKKAYTDHIEYAGDDNGIKKGQIYKISTVGNDEEYIVIGNHKYNRNELKKILCGIQELEHSPFPKHKLGNPVPIGLVGTFVTIFSFGLFLARVKGIEATNVAVGMCMFLGGCVIFLSGVWCFFDGSPMGTFNLTLLTSFSTFWLSFGAIFIPAFGIEDAYADYPDQYNNAIGFLGVAWTMFTTMLLICSLTTTFPIFIALLTLDMATIMLAAGYFLDSAGIKRACGVFAFLHGVSTLYIALEDMATPQTTYFVFKRIPMPRIFTRNK